MRVYAENLEKSVVNKVRSSNKTVVACVSADGSRMPPMFVSKGKTQRSLLGFRTENPNPMRHPSLFGIFRRRVG